MTPNGQSEHYSEETRYRTRNYKRLSNVQRPLLINKAMKWSVFIRDALCIFLLLTVITVPFVAVNSVSSGHVGIVTSFGEIKSIRSPGLALTIPWAQSLTVWDVRARRFVVRNTAATSDEMPITVKTSLVWSPDTSENAIRTMYSKYGTFERFEKNILEPNIEQEVKHIISQYKAKHLLHGRDAARDRIAEPLKTSSNALPYNFSQFYIDDIAFPSEYSDAIKRKMTERQNAEAEAYVLERYSLTAQQQVKKANASQEAEAANTAAAVHDIREKAKAKAESIRLERQAEAEGIIAVGNALKVNPGIIEYARAHKWDGKYPTTMLGEQPNILWSMK